MSLLFLLFASLCASLFLIDDVSAQARTPVSFSKPLISRVEAFSGQPFGVGMLTFRLPPDGGDVNSSLVIQSGAVELTEKNNRILYQVFGKQALARFMGKVSGDGEPAGQMHAIWFLFKGNEPLRLTLHGSDDQEFEMIPVAPRRAKQFQRRLDQWWREYNRAADERAKKGDYPHLIETYLTTMLGQRLGLPLTPQPQDRRDAFRQTIDLMFNVEKLRTDMIRDEMRGIIDLGKREQVLPAPVVWQETAAPKSPADIEIEDMAYYVPEDCFYLRFGTWDNNLWLKKLSAEYGGDLGRMFSLRGYEARIDARFLDQLALGSTDLEDLFAATVISDVAFIGKDTYFSDGPAVGVLLQARNTASFQRRTSKRRKNFAASNEGVTLEEIEIAGEKVSFLSTPNNFRRSFYVVKDDFHLTTNCRKIVEQFIKTRETKRSLGNSAEFRYARSLMPLNEGHTIFAFFSSQFFQHLLHPEFQIELRRRNKAIADMQLLQMAWLAATGEGFSDIDMRTLGDFGFLPANFSAGDFSRYELIDGVWTDSVRGARGFFLPLADANVEMVTQDEYRWFAERAEYFAKSVSQLDPMFAGIKRFELSDNTERIVFDARVAPFGAEKYGMLSKMLGPPIRKEFAGSPNDIISFQMSIGGGMFKKSEPYQIFAGVQDHVDPGLDLRPKSFLDALQTAREVPGYLGAWPKPGNLDFLPQLGRFPDAAGYTYSRLLKLWRLQWDDFSILSFDQSRLEELKSNLVIAPTERASHVKIRVGNIAESKLYDWANILNYRRSWQTSLANVRMLNTLTNQFRLNPELAKGVAEQMLDVKLVCSLGGEYVLKETLGGRKVWCSTAWPNFLNPVVPADYVAPVLGWFRGAEVEVTQAATQFAVHGFVDVKRTGESELPSFKIFKGFGNLLGGSKKNAAGDGKAAEIEPVEGNLKQEVPKELPINGNPEAPGGLEEQLQPQRPKSVLERKS